METLRPIQERYSPMNFLSDKPVEEKHRILLFEAARWAASSYNEQPWRFIYSDRYENPDDYQALLSLLTPYNQRWAATAPLLVMVLAARTFERNGKYNRHAWYDTGMAAASMALQGVSLGIQAHQMGGFDVEKSIERLGIPEPFEPVSIIAIGFPAPLEQVAEEFRERATTPRTRKSLTELIIKRK